MAQRQKSGSKKARFLVFAPHYNPHSVRTRQLYLLGEKLKEQGHETLIVTSDDLGEERASLPRQYEPIYRVLGQTFDARDVSESDIAIYPEIVSNNPLKATNVVRYLLDCPSHSAVAPIEYGPHDLVVAASPHIDEFAVPLPLVCDDRHIYFPGKKSEKRNQAIIYTGKRPRATLSKGTEDFLAQFAEHQVVTPWYPSNDEERAEILRRCQVVVVTEPGSDLCRQAALCGTPVFVADWVERPHYANNEPRPQGMFFNPEDFYAASSAVANVFPAYEQSLSDNERHVRSFVTQCHDHFASLRSRATGAQLARLNRAYLTLRSQADRQATPPTASTNPMAVTHAPNPISPSAPAIGQLFFDCGTGFSEAHSIRQPCSLADGPQHLEFDVSPFGTVYGLRFDPGDNPTCMSLLGFYALSENGARVELLSFVEGNFVRGDAGTLLFDVPDPKVIVRKVINKKLTRVVVDFEGRGTWQLPSGHPALEPRLDAGLVHKVGLTVQHALQTSLKWYRAAR